MTVDQEERDIRYLENLREKKAHRDQFCEALCASLSSISERYDEFPLRGAHLLVRREDVERWVWDAPTPREAGYIPEWNRKEGSPPFYVDEEVSEIWLRHIVYRALTMGTFTASGIEADKVLTGNRLEIPFDRWEILNLDFDTNTASIDGVVVLRGVYVARRQSMTKNKGGAKPKGDWPAYEEAFQRKVDEHGFPDAGNVEGWQTQADVERWLRDLAERDIGDTFGERTIRQYAASFMSKCQP